MSAPTPTDVRGVIAACLAASPAGAGAPPELSDDLDLLESGLLDSFGLLELINELERSFGVELSFEELDPDDVTRVGPLCRHVASAPGSAVASVPSSNGHTAAEEAVTPPSPVELRGRGRLASALGDGAAGTYGFATRLRDKAFSLSVSGSFASFGRRSVIQLPTRLVGHRAIAIGSDVFVGAGSWLQVLGRPEDVAISIGDGTAMAGYCVISAAERIELGRNVSLARGVYISDVAHEYADVDQPVLEQGITSARPIAIGDGAWLGENATVLPGVRIGKGAVVSANSVVTRDVPDHTLVAGVPARVVRRFA